jgi:hypothetical protein
MSINPAGTTNYGWNYSKPDKPGYSTQLVGTVLAIQEVQKMGFTMTGQPGAPEFWPDGNPKMNIRLALATPEGELKTFTFQPAGRKARMGEKKSIHMDLFALTGNTDMMNLIGQTICIQTQEGYYGQGHPRPWYVAFADGGPFQLNMELPAEFKTPRVLANNAVSGGQVNLPQQAYPMPPAPQHPVMQPQPMMQQRPMMQQPGMMMQQQPMQQPMMQQPGMMMQQPMQAQPMMQQQPMQQQPMQQPMQQDQYPGMDPVVAQAMATQVFGDGVQVSMEPAPQPATPVGNGATYDEDEDMPF